LQVLHKTSLIAVKVPKNQSAFLQFLRLGPPTHPKNASIVDRAKENSFFKKQNAPIIFLIW